MQVWAGQYEEAQENAESGLLLSSNNAMAHAVHAWALDFQVLIIMPRRSHPLNKL
jgi:hypothetical protein